MPRPLAFYPAAVREDEVKGMEAAIAITEETVAAMGAVSVTVCAVQGSAG